MSVVRLGTRSFFRILAARKLEREQNIAPPPLLRKVKTYTAEFRSAAGYETQLSAWALLFTWFRRFTDNFIMTRKKGLSILGKLIDYFDVQGLWA